jgi:hypothetical protein
MHVFQLPSFTEAFPFLQQDIAFGMTPPNRILRLPIWPLWLLFNAVYLFALRHNTLPLLTPSILFVTRDVQQPVKPVCAAAGKLLNPGLSVVLPHSPLHLCPLWTL